MTRPTISMESSFSGIVAGIDEAGCGPWAGPVVAAAVIMHPRRRVSGINDSKKLPATKREALYDVIAGCCQIGVGMATVSEIDTLNILQATKLAMCRALEKLGTRPDVALVDGNRRPDLPCATHMVIGGDALCTSIAAASIIAKVTRDRIMGQLGLEYPGYGWETNAGYGTKHHQRAMVNLGITPHHRRSFAPVRTMLEVTDLFAA